MDIITLRVFFFWCTVINGIVLLIPFLACIVAKDWAYLIHSRIFGVSRETFNTVIYSFIQLYKIFWMIFNFVPWLALLIMA